MWYGVLAPKGTPAPIVERLNRELKDILARADVKAAFETQGMLPTHSTPDAFRQVIAADAKRWSELIQAQGITAN
jgi:tripartite-type tricarboxylate transporter receptor subunit TctC